MRLVLVVFLFLVGCSEPDEVVRTSAWSARVVGIEGAVEFDDDGARLCIVSTMDTRPTPGSSPYHETEGFSVCEIIDGGLSKGDLVMRVCEVRESGVTCIVEGW